MARLHSQRLNKKGDRRKVITIVLRIIIVLAVVITIWAQNNLLTVYNTIYSVPNLPKSWVGFKVVHISDMNNSMVDVVEKTRQLQPNLIFLTGGYVDANGNYQNTLSQIQQLSQIAPIFYVYNDEDGQQDILNGLGQYLNDRALILKANSFQTMDAREFITKNYGAKTLASLDADPDNGANYINYVQEQLNKTAESEMRVIGLTTHTDNENGKYDALKILNGMTEVQKCDYNIVLTGNIAFSKTISRSGVDAIFGGGTYGTDRIDPNYKKGSYNIGGSQLFLSGGVGGHEGVTRVFNFPEIQCITFSDGTIVEQNPLEEFIGKFFKDVGTIYDNDGGFTAGPVQVNKQ